ncbi:MAG: glycosyltransferase family 4 protein [Anaerolineae bacterium]
MKPTERARSGKRAMGSRVAHVASYRPRECGIATYTADLIASLGKESPEHPNIVIAVNDREAHYNYAEEVEFQIEQYDEATYTAAADFVNRSGISLASLQHEHGLFGGRDGEYILTFLTKVSAPVITTLHTVLPEPKPHFKKVTAQVAAQSDSVVVLARTAKRILADTYAVPGDKMHFIPHGAPKVSRREGARRRIKRRLGLNGRRILMTFGLINPNKGIEYVLQALPQIVDMYPEVLYLVVGESHPQVRLHRGESYRRKLLRIVSNLGLQGHVRFHNRFLPLEELIQYMLATDVYIMPYLNPNQIVSGTLAYAMATAKAIVATPFLYAKEVLAEGRGILVDFREADSIARAVLRLLSDRELLLEVERRAYDYGRKMTWPRVARKYEQLFKRVLRKHPRQ